MEWAAISYFRRSSRPKDQTHVSCITSRFFTTELPGKPESDREVRKNQASRVTSRSLVCTRGRRVVPFTETGDSGRDQVLR